MYLGVVPDVLPLAPRPIAMELRSSWLLRVAAANVLTLAELVAAVAARHPDAGADDAFLDDALSADASAAFAQFARLPAIMVRALDLSDQIPGLPESWMLRTGLQPGSRDRLSDRRAHYAFCPQCLGAVASAQPPYLPVEWACAVVTHCPTHRTRLQERCPVCYVDDPFSVGVLAHAGRAKCWQCQARLSEPLWHVDRSVGVDGVMQLQTVLLAAMRGHAPALIATGPLSARAVVTLVDQLVDLLIGSDAGDPAFTRVAAVHWPADLGVIRAHNRPSRVASFPVAWRFIVMAIVASVLIDAPDSTATIQGEAATLLDRPLHTLMGSLVDAEWGRWEDRMSGWPGPVRATLQAARRLSAH